MSSIDIVANPYKKDFPLLTSMPDLAFLDSAATAQRLPASSRRRTASIRP